MSNDVDLEGNERPRAAGTSYPRSVVPVPDPTVLTTQALQREIQAARELTEQKVLALKELLDLRVKEAEQTRRINEATINGIREVIETRLSGMDEAIKLLRNNDLIIGIRDVLETRLAGMDKAIELLQKANDMIPEHIDGAVDRLQNLHQEKFASIETQFQERDKRTEQLSLADKTAIAAALQAQKEAAGAQNDSNAASVTKSEAAFTKLIDQTQTLLNTVTKSMDDKINDLKSRFDKGEGRITGGGESWATITAAVGVVISIGTLFFLIFSHQNQPLSGLQYQPQTQLYQPQQDRKQQP